MTGALAAPVHVRPPRSGELDVAIALLRDALGPDAPSEAAMRADLTSPTRHYVVAVQPEGDGSSTMPPRVLGVAGMLVSDVAEVLAVAVHPEVRRRGVAGELLAALREEAVCRGAAAVWLEVAETNVAARALYAQVGFQPVGRRHRYYADGSAAVTMSLDLAAVPEVRRTPSVGGGR